MSIISLPKCLSCGLVLPLTPCPGGRGFRPCFQITIVLNSSIRQFAYDLSSSAKMASAAAFFSTNFKQSTLFCSILQFFIPIIHDDSKPRMGTVHRSATIGNSGPITGFRSQRQKLLPLSCVWQRNSTQSRLCLSLRDAIDVPATNCVSRRMAPLLEQSITSLMVLSFKLKKQCTIRVRFFVELAIFGKQGFVTDSAARQRVACRRTCIAL